MSWHQETPQDLANEAKVGHLVFERWHCRAEKMSTRYEVDYALLRRGKVMAWAEIKCRKNIRAKYDTYAVGLRKIMSGQALATATNLPFLLIVRWTDALGWIAPEMNDVRWGGRFDRNDAQDIEPMVHIPISAFKLI